MGAGTLIGIVKVSQVPFTFYNVSHIGQIVKWPSCLTLNRTIE